MFFRPKVSFALFACVLGFSPQAPSLGIRTQTSAQENSPQEARTSQSSTPANETPSSPSSKNNLRQQAWTVLHTGATAEKSTDRAAAVNATGLLRDDPRARKIAETALQDDAPEVRSTAAAALGEMHARSSIPKLRAALDDKDVAVALAAAHALLQLKDDAGYAVYYEILTGERKGGKGVLAEAAAYEDPKKLAELGIGFIPYAGLGWGAYKMIKKDDASPARAAAAIVLAEDRDQKTTDALVNAAGDKNWIIRSAALAALARRGDPSVLDTIELYLSDQEGDVKYKAAAATLRLTAIRQSGTKNKKQ